MVGRGWRVLLKAFGKQTNRLWNLSRLSTELGERVSEIECPPEWESRCVCCKKLKKPKHAIRGDANSYYTRIRRERIVAAIDYFLDRAQHEFGTQTVTLLRKAKYRGFLGGSQGCQERDRVVLKFEELRQGLLFEVDHLNIASFAEYTLRLKYPPMGGILSETICTIVASHWECCLDDLTPHLVACQMIPASASRASAFVASVGSCG